MAGPRLRPGRGAAQQPWPWPSRRPRYKAHGAGLGRPRALQPAAPGPVPLVRSRGGILPRQLLQWLWRRPTSRRAAGMQFCASRVAGTTACATPSRAIFRVQLSIKQIQVQCKRKNPDADPAHISKSVSHRARSHFSPAVSRRQQPASQSTGLDALPAARRSGGVWTQHIWRERPVRPGTASIHHRFRDQLLSVFTHAIAPPEDAELLIQGEVAGGGGGPAARTAAPAAYRKS